MPKKYNERVPDEIREAILHEIRTTDRMYTEIAPDYGVSRYFISKLAREHGIEKRTTPKKKADPATDRAIADEFTRDDLTASEIAAKYKRSKSYVLDVVRRLAPEVDTAARGRRMGIRTKFGAEAVCRAESRSAQKKKDYARRVAAKRRLESCPREQKIQQSKREAQSSPHCRAVAEPYMSWADIAAELKRRYEEGETELEGSFDQRTLNMSAIKALEKIRPLLEQYEYADDTPNRSFAHLHETVA